MLWTPQKGIVRVQHNAGNVGDNTIGATVTTGAAASTKGTPVEIFAATSFDAYWIRIMAQDYALAATNSGGALDILTGAATEEVLIPDLLMGFCGIGLATNASEKGGKQWMFPLYIPEGSRIAARVAGDRVSTAMRVAVWLYGGDGSPGFRVGSKITTYGMGTVPDGTTLTPGASGAEGAWTQIVASTTEDHFAFLPSFQTPDDTTLTTGTFQVDIGVGAATEEELVGGSGWFFHGDNAETLSGPWPPMPAFQDVPSGSRLVVRASKSTALDTANENAVIHAVS